MHRYRLRATPSVSTFINYDPLHVLSLSNACFASQFLGAETSVNLHTMPVLLHVLFPMFLLKVVHTCVAGSAMLTNYDLHASPAFL